MSGPRDGYCHCGCGEKTNIARRNARQEVKGQPYKYIKGHLEPADKRFWRYVDKSSDCWIWTGSINGTGRGQFGVGGKIHTAPRFSWIIAFGEIAEGMYVCHKCDNPLCVNPSHLFLGTPKENMQDCIKKGRFNSTPQARPQYGPSEGKPALRSN